MAEGLETMQLRVVAWTAVLSLTALGLAIGIVAAQYRLWGIEAADVYQMSRMTMVTVGLIAPSYVGPLVWLAFRHHDLSAQLRDVALTDALTGIANRRAFFEHLAQRFGPEERLTAFSVLMIDVDRFKAINDRLGHEAGDAALAFIAARITHSLRRLRVEDVILARIGGEEFAVFLPLAGLSTATRVADAICADMRQAEFRRGGEVIPVTVSIGVWSGQAEGGADAALALADRAAYVAKAKGRDRWEVAGDAIGLAA